MWYMAEITPEIYDYDLLDFRYLRKTHTIWKELQKRCEIAAMENIDIIISHIVGSGQGSTKNVDTAQ